MEMHEMIANSNDSGGVFISSYLGVITGISLGTEKNNLIRAAVEGICADLRHIISGS